MAETNLTSFGPPLFTRSTHCDTSPVKCLALRQRCSRQLDSPLFGTLSPFASRTERRGESKGCRQRGWSRRHLSFFAGDFEIGAEPAQVAKEFCNFGGEGHR